MGFNSVFKGLNVQEEIYASGYKCLGFDDRAIIHLIKKVAMEMLARGAMNSGLKLPVQSVVVRYCLRSPGIWNR
jgi:hypothetical protein